MQAHLARVGAVAAIGGALLLMITTYLHPVGADPNDAQAAFAEYAADSLWVASHLGQFVAVAVLSVALVALATTIDGGRAAAWARVGVRGVSATVAAAAALQAVDGVALKLVVDRWAQASGEARVLAFEAAFAVRQVEIGLASLLSVIFGLTVSVFGIALLLSPRFAPWSGWLGLVSGGATVTAGVAQAYTGFSTVAMSMSMPASVLLLIWVVVVGVRLWRLAPELRRIEAVQPMVS
jgi:hypothetical protein